MYVFREGKGENVTFYLKFRNFELMTKMVIIHIFGKSLKKFFNRGNAFCLKGMDASAPESEVT